MEWRLEKNARDIFTCMVGIVKFNEPNINLDFLTSSLPIQKHIESFSDEFVRLEIENLLLQCSVDSLTYFDQCGFFNNDDIFDAIVKVLTDRNLIEENHFKNIKQRLILRRKSTFEGDVSDQSVANCIPSTSGVSNFIECITIEDSDHESLGDEDESCVESLSHNVSEVS